MGRNFIFQTLGWAKAHQAHPMGTPLVPGAISGVILSGARAPLISHFAENIFNRLSLAGPLVLFSLVPLKRTLVPLFWTRVWRPFLDLAGSFNILVQYFWREGLINWSNFWSASDVGLFRTKNPTFPLFVCSAVPQNLFRYACFYSLTDFRQFPSFFCSV
jgi:hypothetical protein